MGSYLNPSSKSFRDSVDSKIYVDKSGLIQQINSVVNTEQKYVCVSRPRRFGKSMAANMLAAYYGKGEDTTSLFDHLKISKEESYKKHLNQYDVIKVNMQEFLSATGDVDKMLSALQKRLIAELKREYPEHAESEHLSWVMADIFAATNRPFVILIDEWDCLFREYSHNEEAQKKYLDFLRGWLKDQAYVALAYMTGILPIKKYGTHSALNMFSEYSMTNPGALAEYFGFTEDEVKQLCAQYHMSFEEAKEWYDGYELSTHSRNEENVYSMYSPKSVVDAMLRQVYDTYWNQTETYEALKAYIQMNLDGLKDAIVQMIGEGRVQINTGTFDNDMTSLHSRDDALTLLAHLGYLSYRWSDKTVTIPNKEVHQEYINAISTMDWDEITRALKESRELLKALWNMDCEAVAEGIDRAHDEISILKYNDENSLACAIQIAFYAAREHYTVVRELPAGKGYADICLIPRRVHMDKPAAIIELKYEKSAEGAIEQIKRKEYVKALADYKGNLLLAGINYGKDKKHTCIIEKVKL